MTKIIGVGWQKTGTTSLGKAFRILGLRSTGWQPVTAAVYKSGHSQALLDAAQHFDAFEDTPWNLLYPQLVARYPGSKLVLTLRKDMDRWFDSLARHIARTPPLPFGLFELLYGTPAIEQDRDRAIARHQLHIAKVRQFAADNAVPLLEVCWDDGDGWLELCRFLDRPVPPLPFPHANAAPGNKLVLKKKIKRLIGR